MAAELLESSVGGVMAAAAAGTLLWLQQRRRRGPWIWECISSPRVSILVNRSPTKEFRMRKGIRQGNSLSPFLFISVNEALHLLLMKAEKVGNIEGYVAPIQIRIQIRGQETTISKIIGYGDSKAVSYYRGTSRYVPQPSPVLSRCRKRDSFAVPVLHRLKLADDTVLYCCLSSLRWSKTIWTIYVFDTNGRISNPMSCGWIFCISGVTKAGWGGCGGCLRSPYGFLKALFYGPSKESSSIGSELEAIKVALEVFLEAKFEGARSLVA
ncbi:hypothetical protein F3Y22_tig00000778pilonHSYRG00435 [Hibiscus syriacus]|uniref:Uncharacterized protein n=1 Tax=Hibiscus syriacus TaxID=106335 RepID=A0A6A3D4U5_HIBSY|nr:hypothetical protein F3Y22_tig00000778pilonHSYRG00435 [Hibiscus syriacus]